MNITCNSKGCCPFYGDIRKIENNTNKKRSLQFDKDVADNVCELYNNVGDIDMLNYLYKLDLNDNKAKYMLNNMIELNEKMLDTNTYLDYRREFLNYLGFDLNDYGLLVYTKDYVDRKGADSNE